jgi:hypothetical protein
VLWRREGVVEGGSGGWCNVEREWRAGDSSKPHAPLADR